MTTAPVLQPPAIGEARVRYGPVVSSRPDLYTTDQMRQYATDAIAAAQAGQSKDAGQLTDEKTEAEWKAFQKRRAMQAKF